MHIFCLETFELRISSIDKRLKPNKKLFQSSTPSFSSCQLDAYFNSCNKQFKNKHGLKIHMSKSTKHKAELAMLSRINNNDILFLNSKMSQLCSEFSLMKLE